MWLIQTTDVFDDWFDALGDTDRANVIAAMLVLQQKGPFLSRPYVDTVNGSAYTNMKELRIQSKGSPIRAFFAFDPDRVGVLLCAGDKTGRGIRFYREMIALADREFAAHLKAFKRDR